MRSGILYTVLSVLTIGILAGSLFHSSAAEKPAGKRSDVLNDRDQQEDYSVFNSSEYKDLPRLSFKLLIEDSTFLKGESFKGILYPRRLVKAPWQMIPMLGKDREVLIAGTKSGRNSMYIILPAGTKKGIARIIKSKKKMYFIYTPVFTLGNMPVVRMIHELSMEAQDEGKIVKFEISRYYPAIQGSKWTIEVGRRVRILEYEILEMKKNYAKGTKREIIPAKPGSEKMTDFYVYYDRDKITTVEEGFSGAGTPYKQSDVILKTPLTAGTNWLVKLDKEERKREIAGVHDTVTVGVREFKDVLIIRELTSVESDLSSYFAVTYYFYAADVGFLGCKIDSADQKENLKQYNQIDEWFIQRLE